MLGHEIAHISGRPKDSDGNVSAATVVFTTTGGSLNKHSWP